MLNRSAVMYECMNWNIFTFFVLLGACSPRQYMLICIKMDIVNIFQNIPFCVSQKKECHKGLEHVYVRILWKLFLCSLMQIQSIFNPSAMSLSERCIFIGSFPRSIATYTICNAYVDNLYFRKFYQYIFTPIIKKR